MQEETKKTKYDCRFRKVLFLALVFSMLAALIALIVSFSVLDFLSIRTTIALFILGFFALAFLSHGIIYYNPISLYIGVLFLVPSIVEIILRFTTLTYGQIYPLYIAMPFFASLICAIVFVKFRPHILPLVYFLLIAGIFAVHSSGAAGLVVVLPIFAGITLAAAVFLAVSIVKRKRKKDA